MIEYEFKFRPIAQDDEQNDDSNVFMEELGSISGVDEREAEILYKHGYQSEEEIRKAEQMELAGIEGIGNALTARMKADVGDLGPNGEDDDELDSLRYTFNQTPSIDAASLTRREIRLADEDVPVVVGEDVDEITLKKDGEERTVDVDEVFDEEEMDCTCGPNEGCSECPDGKHGFSTGEKMSVTISGNDVPRTYGEALEHNYIGGGLEEEEIDPEFAKEVDEDIEELEQDSNEDRAVCASPYCEQWADSCSKHGDAS